MVSLQPGWHIIAKWVRREVQLLCIPTKQRPRPRPIAVLRNRGTTALEFVCASITVEFCGAIAIRVWSVHCCMIKRGCFLPLSARWVGGNRAYHSPALPFLPPPRPNHAIRGHLATRYQEGSSNALLAYVLAAAAGSCVPQTGGAGAASGYPNRVRSAPRRTPSHRDNPASAHVDEGFIFGMSSARPLSHPSRKIN